MQPKRKIKSISGIRDFSVCEIQKILLVVVYDVVKIYDVDLQAPLYCIKLQSSPRQAKLTPNGRLFIIFLNDYSINVYDTAFGILLQKITSVPTSAKAIRISGDSQKLLFASSQILCLWSIKQCGLQIRTQNWRNINCFDLNQDGTQFAIGSYNGVISLIKYVGNGRCTQSEIKRHKNCIMAVCFHKNKLISASYDGQLLISTLSVSQNGQRQVTYNELTLANVPREIQSVGNRFYLISHRGITWFRDDFVLVGFVDDKCYKPLVNEDNELIFVKLIASQMEWWPCGY